MPTTEARPLHRMCPGLTIHTMLSLNKVSNQSNLLYSAKENIFEGMPNQGQQQVAHLNFNQFQGPPVSNPLTNAAGAPPFQPGNPQMIHYPHQQPVQMVYQTNGPPKQQHMAMGHAGHPAIFTPGQRFHAPAAHIFQTVKGRLRNLRSSYKVQI